MSKEFDLVTDSYLEIKFDDLGLNPIHPQDYSLNISYNPSGDVYLQFLRNGVPIQPNLIEERLFKTFVSLANKKINYENNK